MEHYYSEQQKSFVNTKRINQKIRGVEFFFFTSSGTFSRNRVDRGTLLLAENMIVKKNCKILDIGCGIGVLGIAAARLFNSNAVMTDINKRAVMLAMNNTRLNNAKAEIYQGNLYEKIKNNYFDVILSNPPQNAGRDICFSIIEDAKEHLKVNGTLQLVARHNKGGKTLSEKMHEVFGNVEVIAKKAGYWVYLSFKGD